MAQVVKKVKNAVTAPKRHWELRESEQEVVEAVSVVAEELTPIIAALVAGYFYGKDARKPASVIAGFLSGFVGRAAGFFMSTAIKAHNSSVYTFDDVVHYAPGVGKLHHKLVEASKKASDSVADGIDKANLVDVARYALPVINNKIAGFDAPGKEEFVEGVKEHLPQSETVAALVDLAFAIGEALFAPKAPAIEPIQAAPTTHTITAS